MSILPIFIPHAGCPHQCVFCNQRTISGQKKPALEGAKEQIKRWLQWFRPSQEQEAAFYGGSFTALDFGLQEQLLQLTDELIDKKVIGRVRLSTRPDCITPDGLELLLQHHVYLVELGVQSMDDEVLQLAERGHKSEAVTTAMNLLKQYGFKTGIQLMVGMPGQSFASVKATADCVVELQPDIARIYPLLVIKETPLAKQYAQGSFTPLTIEEAVEQAAYVYGQLTAAGIKVIRIGLQADEELCTEGNIVAGPFHPSMGEMVKSRLLLNRIYKAIGLDTDMTSAGILGSSLRNGQSKQPCKQENQEHKKYQEQLKIITKRIFSADGEPLDLEFLQRTENFTSVDGIEQYPTCTKSHIRALPMLDGDDASVSLPTDDRYDSVAGVAAPKTSSQYHDLYPVMHFAYELRVSCSPRLRSQVMGLKKCNYYALLKKNILLQFK